MDTIFVILVPSGTLKTSLVGEHFGFPRVGSSGGFLPSL